MGRRSAVRAAVGRGAALLHRPQPDAARRSGGVGERRRGDWRRGRGRAAGAPGARSHRRRRVSRSSPPVAAAGGRRHRQQRSGRGDRRPGRRLRAGAPRRRDWPRRRGHPCRMARHRQPSDHRRRERAAGHLRRAPRARHRGRRAVHRPVLLRGGGEHLRDVPPGRTPRLGARPLVRAAAGREVPPRLAGARRAINSRAPASCRRTFTSPSCARRPTPTSFTRTVCTEPRREG